MSHYTKMSVDYRQTYEPELLLAIEAALDVKPEVHENPVELYNYWDEGTSGKVKEDEKSEKCHIVVRKDQGKLARRATNDCGWRRSSDGVGYDAFIDAAGVNEDELGKISQIYAASVAEKKLRAQGYVTQRQQLENGHVQLVASKY